MDKKEILPEERWTLIIGPKSKWFSLNLREVWNYRDLIVMFIKRDFISTYKQNILGPLWFIIQPLFATYLFAFVFSNIAGLSTGKIPSVLFYLSGLTVWNYFATCFTKTSTTFMANSILFGKVYFPRLTSPISMVISNLITFSIQLILFLAFLGYYVLFKAQEFHFNVYFFIIPYLIILMAMLGLGLGIIITSLTIKYRDLNNLVAFGIQFLMYLTTVIYPLEAIQGRKRLLLMANPMTSIIETFRYVFFPNGPILWKLLGYSSILTLVIFLIGVLLFSKTEKNFMDTI